MRFLYRSILINGIVGVFCVSCSSTTDLTNNYVEKLKYEDLPEDVQGVYKEIISSRSWGDGSSDTLVNLSDEDIRFEKNVMTDDFVETVSLGGAYYHFYIESDHYILKANQGDPFVILSDFLYHIEGLNTSEDEYLQATYLKYELR